MQDTTAARVTGTRQVSGHLEYLLEISSDSQTWSVWRRYSQFSKARARCHAATWLNEDQRQRGEAAVSDALDLALAESRKVGYVWMERMVLKDREASLDELHKQHAWANVQVASVS